jgi:hypothetical protein
LYFAWGIEAYQESAGISRKMPNGEEKDYYEKQGKKVNLREY